MNKILLIGDNCTDRFIYGNCYRLNPEAPTPVLSKIHETENPGMAGNVLKNLNALGFTVDFITHSTIRYKIRYVDEKSNYILLRLDDDSLVDNVDIKSIDLSKYEMIIISDYDKGFLSIKDLEFIFSNNNLTFIDTKKPLDNWILGASYIKINEVEYTNPKNNLNILPKLYDKIIVTLGERGAMYKDKIYTPQHQVLVRDFVGAGDTFLATLASHYYLYKNIVTAINCANNCAAEVVSKRGIAYPSRKLL